MRQSRSSRIAWVIVGLAVIAVTAYALTSVFSPSAPREQTRGDWLAPPDPVHGWGSPRVVETDETPPRSMIKITLPTVRVVGRGVVPRRRPRYNVGEIPEGPRLGPPPTGVMARFSAPEPAVYAEELPVVPERESIRSLMRSLRQRVQQCYDEGMIPGKVDLVLVVEGRTGQVKDASATPATSTADCVLGAARHLRFPRFSREQATVRYPYTFR